MPARDPSRKIKVALRARQQATDPIERLKASLRIREAAEALEAEAIEEARQNGATWREIGSYYGLTKQGAQQRFRTAPQQQPTLTRKKATRGRAPATS